MLVTYFLLHESELSQFPNALRGICFIMLHISKQTTSTVLKQLESHQLS